MSTPPLPPLTYSFVISETKRIITSNSRHFKSLTLLFILPISSFLTIFPAVQTLLLRRHRESPPPSDQTQFHALAPGFLFALFPSVFTFLAVGSITHSVIQIHHNRPATLPAAVKSAFTSFFPIAVTQFVANFLFSLIALILLCVMKSFGIDPGSPWFLVAAVTYSAVLFSALIYLDLNWALAPAIAAAESRIGFSALKQSRDLVAGERLAILRIFSTYALAVGAFAWTSWSWIVKAVSDGVCVGGGWNNSSCLLSAATTVLVWFILTQLLLSLFVARTVVYLYCKAARGGGVIFENHGGDEKVSLLSSGVV